MALEIFSCEVNPLLEKFFEAPEPKEETQQNDTAAANEDMVMSDGNYGNEVLTDDLGAAATDDKDNDLDFDNVFGVKSNDSADKTENTFSFDTPADTKEEEKKEGEETKQPEEEEEKKTDAEESKESTDSQETASEEAGSNSSR